MDRPSSLPQVVPATPKRRGPSRGRHLSPISATDLLSTSTRWICQLSGAGLSPAHPPLPALPADPRPRASRHDRAVHGDVGQPQAASPTPSGDAVGAASPGVPVCHRSPKGAPSILLGQDPRWFVRPRVSRVARRPTLPVTPASRGGCRRRVRREPRIFPAAYAKSAVFRIRSAFRRRVLRAAHPRLRGRSGYEDRHWYLGLAASAQLPTRFHA